MFETRVVEKIKKYILCSITFYHPKTLYYEIRWKNIVGPDRPQMKRQCMYNAY
jgi:hypothetical protein